MEESELRRGQNTLFILGGGVITFGVWSVVKMIMYFALDPAKYFHFDDIPQEYRLLAMAFAYGIIALIVGLDVGLRFYVGLSARAEARGKKKSRAYIIVAAPDNILDTAVSTIVDITAQITLIELVLTARRVQRLRKLLSV